MGTFKSKRYYANLLKLMYIFKYKKRDRGNLSRTNKAFHKALIRYGQNKWLELARIN